MEKNIVVIDLEKYENLIKKVENQKNEISNLKQELEQQTSKNKNVNNAIYRKIYDDKRWDLKQIVYDRKNNFDYHSKVIKEKFKEYGYDDENYINECIESMIEDKENELKKGSEE